MIEWWWLIPFFASGFATGAILIGGLRFDHHRRRRTGA